jgi:hypothetical protein
MIDITEKGTEWVERWQEVTFSPSHLFAKDKFKLDSTAFLFAIGCLLIGYFAAMFGAAVYFWRYYPKNLQAHLDPKEFKGMAAAVSITSGVYVGVVIVVLLFTSAISYSVYKKCGSLRKFSDHFATELGFLNMEPIAAVALTIATINFALHPFLGTLCVSIFFFTRVYYFFLAYKAFTNLHKLPPTKNRMAFFLGYFPVALISGAIQFLIFSFVAVFATSNFD